MIYKKCNFCLEIKGINNFSKDVHSKDGYQNRCKLCSSEIIKKYYKTINGLITNIYSHQRSNSKKYNREYPNYTLQEFKNWCIKQKKFNDVYLNWINSKYIEDKKPSIDRIDCNLPYTLNNIQVMTWFENRNKGHIERSKKINQYNMTGEFIQTYNSFMDIERKLKIDRSSLCNACNNKINHAG